MAYFFVGWEFDLNGMLSAAAKKLRFDWHSDLIAFALKHPLLGQLAQRERPAKANSCDY
jgi:hypothetical protein